MLILLVVYNKTMMVAKTADLNKNILTWYSAKISKKHLQWRFTIITNEFTVFFMLNMCVLSFFLKDVQQIWLLNHVTGYIERIMDKNWSMKIIVPLPNIMGSNRIDNILNYI